MVDNFTERILHQILSTVSNAVVFIDNGAAECLHWSNGVERLFTAGALDIRDITDPRDCLESQDKAVFIVSTPLTGKIYKDIQQIVLSNDFQQSTVICSVSLFVHEFISSSQSQTYGSAIFGEFSKNLKIWMGNEYSTADVRHIPLFHAQILPDVFITPVCNEIFSILPSDVARLQAFLHSRFTQNFGILRAVRTAGHYQLKVDKNSIALGSTDQSPPPHKIECVMGDKRLFNNLGDIDLSFLPHNFQSQVKLNWRNHISEHWLSSSLMLASSLDNIFDVMSINEDCYGAGHFAKLMATELANLPSARARRKMATSRASVVFIDRLLDLVGPTSHSSDNIMDTVMEILPKLPGHHNDVAIDMKELFANGKYGFAEGHGRGFSCELAAVGVCASVTPETLFPGCMAHTGDPLANDLIETLLMQMPKDVLKHIERKLQEFLKKENLDVEKSGDKPPLERLKHYLNYFRNNFKLFEKYSGFLQCAMAVVNALKDADNEHREEILSAQKVMMLELSGGSNAGILSRVLALLTKRESIRFSVIDALLLCLHFYSAVGESDHVDPAEEERLKEAVISILLDGDHEDDCLFFMGNPSPTEREVRMRVADIFERLRGIGQAREGLKQTKALISKGSAGEVTYRPLLSQIVKLIFHPDKPDLIDVEFRSHGFKDFLKTGFGLFMNVSKPRPDDHPALFLFVIGGITFSEIRQIRNIIKQLRPSSKVIIGSTRIVTPTDILEQVLCHENLFVDIE